MDELQRQAMKELQSEMIVKEVPVDILFLHLLGTLFTQNEYDWFNNHLSMRSERINYLINAVMNKGDGINDTFIMFSEALRAVKMGWLADKLHNAYEEKRNAPIIKSSWPGFDQNKFKHYLADMIVPLCETIQRQWELMYGLTNAELYRIYQPLEICKTNKQNKETMLKTDMSIHKLLAEKAVNNVELIEGDPGIGKTTFVNKLAQEWAAATSERYAYILAPAYCTDVHRADVNLLKEKFDFVFLVPLNTIQERSIITHIENIIHKFAPTTNFASEIMTYLLHNDRTLLVLDGYDERQPAHVYDLINGRIPGKDNTYMVSCRIIVTIRSYYVERIPDFDQFLQKVNNWFRIKGFGFEAMQSYFNKQGVNITNMAEICQFYNQLLCLHEFQLNKRKLI